MQPQPRTRSSERLQIDVHLAEPDTTEAQDELLAALRERPRRIPSKYFYDDRGSELFEQICELPEYYPTRTEAAILETSADEIVRRNDAHELVELGSGAATKTRILLDAMEGAEQLERYVPVDVSEWIVRRVADELVDEYPQLEVHGVVADFLTDLGKLPDGGQRLVAFLGGTIGNLHPETEAIEFLQQVSGVMESGDYLLMGTDLIKDRAIIEAAYNDSQGVTAKFNRNALTVVNDGFEADFDPSAFGHRAFYNEEHDWIEMRLVSRRDQRVRIDSLDLALELDDGEEILTEISTKFDRRRVADLCTASRLHLVGWFTDPRELFALAVAEPVIGGALGETAVPQGS